MNYEPVLVLDMQIIIESGGESFSSKSASFVCEKCVSEDFSSCPRAGLAGKFELPPEVFKAAEYVDVELAEVEQPNYRSPCERILYALEQMTALPAGVSFKFHLLLVFVEIMKQNLKERAWVDNMDNLTSRYKTWLLAKFKKNLSDLMVDQNMKLFSKEKLATLKLYCRCHGISFEDLKLRSALPPTQVFRNNYKRRDGDDFGAKTFAERKKKRREVGVREEARVKVERKTLESDKKRGRLGVKYGKKSSSLLGGRAKMASAFGRNGNEGDIKGDDQSQYKNKRVKREEIEGYDMENRGNDSVKNLQGVSVDRLKIERGNLNYAKAKANKGGMEDRANKASHAKSSDRVVKEEKEKDEYTAEPVDLLRDTPDSNVQRFEVNNLNYQQTQRQNKPRAPQYNQNNSLDLLTTVSNPAQFPNPKPQRRKPDSKPKNLQKLTPLEADRTPNPHKPSKLTEKQAKLSKEGTVTSQCLDSESHYAPSALIKNFGHSFPQNPEANQPSLNLETSQLKLETKRGIKKLLSMPTQLESLEKEKFGFDRKANLGKQAGEKISPTSKANQAKFGKFHDVRIPSLKKIISSNQAPEDARKKRKSEKSAQKSHLTENLQKPGGASKNEALRPGKDSKNIFFINVQNNHFEINQRSGGEERGGGSLLGGESRDATAERANKKISELDGLLGNLIDNLNNLKDYVLKVGLSDAQIQRKGRFGFGDVFVSIKSGCVRFFTRHI